MNTNLRQYLRVLRRNFDVSLLKTNLLHYYTIYNIILYYINSILLPSTRKFKDNIKMDLQEVGWRDMDWIDLA